VSFFDFDTKPVWVIFPSNRRSFPMRAVLVAVFIASLATPGFAQQPQHMPQYGETDKEKTQAEKNADKAAADAYQRSLGVIPDKGKSDPWGTVRSTDAPKPAPAKSAKSKTAKTGGADAKPQ
jgi:hypothetical protein